MNNWWRSDPPGTVNPAKLSAKLSARAGAATDTFEISNTSCPHIPSDTQIAPEAASQSCPSAAPISIIPRSVVLPLPRISSDWDPEHDIVYGGISRHGDIRKEFEEFNVAKRRPAAAKARHTLHHAYFRSQTEDGGRVRVPVDLGANPDATVVVDKATASIYDAYLLRADIMKNVNIFWRQQIVFNPGPKNYTLLTREGRIGLQGVSRQVMESTGLKAVTLRFRRIFRDKTGLAWNRRYEPRLPREANFMFVELDYHGTLATPKELPSYAKVNAKVEEEVRNLMEDMLYGGPMWERNGSENPSTSRSWSAFSAPYELLSSWTIFSSFKTLERIWKHIESRRHIHWKAILRASSQYRSQIPFCAESDRAPVISSYHAIFLELKFLHSLRPCQDIARMMTEIHRRGSLQFNAHKALAQPLYQAYCSLPHGFRRLTDSSTLEFRELKDYLERSSNHRHYLTPELQEIYRVFVKADLPNPYRDWIEAKQSYGVGDEERLLLWHGTPLDSLLGILDLGLQIRRRGANWTGTMFGNGIYLADASSKSASFCQHRLWNGEAVLLLCEADVGVSRIRSRHSIANGHDVIKNSGGLHRCIEGLGKVGPAKWKEVGWQMGGLPCAGGGMILMASRLEPLPNLPEFWMAFVTNSDVISQPDTTAPYGDTFSGGSLGFNEYVIYDPSHLVIRYLFRVKVSSR